MIVIGAAFLPVFIKQLFDNRRILRDLEAIPTPKPRVKRNGYGELDFGPNSHLNLLEEDLDSMEEEELYNRVQLLYGREPGSIRADDVDLEDQTETLEKFKPELTIWCDGYKLRPKDPEDIDFFESHVVPRAQRHGDYDGLPLSDGGKISPYVDGYTRLYIDWFIMLGCSRSRAEDLVYDGVMKPWELGEN